MNPGQPYPLGATHGPGGVNFALAAPNATRVDLCLFDDPQTSEQQRIALPACTDGVWHGHLPGGRPGLLYGYRVHGPWAPRDGHRFNPAKLLLDPYAREIVGRYDGGGLFAGHDAADPPRPDPRDNSPIALKARVADALPPYRPQVERPVVAAADRVICEIHVRGHTRLHPGVPEPLRGSFAGLAQPVVLDHLQRLGVTTLSLLPVQHRADEERLLGMNLSNYWGYNTIGWFAPEARYWSGRAGTRPASEFRALADAVHARGMELLIDVVYNHSAETDEHGPTLSLRGIDNAVYYRLAKDDRTRYENWTGCGNSLDFTQPRVVQLAMDSLRHWVVELGVDGFRFDLAPVLARTGGAGAHDFDARAPFFAAVAQDPVLARTLLVAEPWDIGPHGYCLGRFPPGWLEWNDKYRDTQRAFWLHAGVSRGDFAHRLTASSGEFEHHGRAPTAGVNFITAHDGFTLRDLVSYDTRHNHANGEDNRDGSDRNLSRNFGAEGETDDPGVRAERRRMQRTLLAVLMLSQGTPMLLAGDEIGHSQRGNNNAYCQDNEITWLDWARADMALAGFVARLAALRRRAAPLRSARWWPAEGAVDHPGLRWLTPDGGDMTTADWRLPDTHAMMVRFAGAEASDAWLLLVNAGAAPAEFSLPAGQWRCELATDEADDPPPAAEARRLRSGETVGARSLWLARCEAAPRPAESKETP